MLAVLWPEIRIAIFSHRGAVRSKRPNVPIRSGPHWQKSANLSVPGRSNSLACVGKPETILVCGRVISDDRPTATMTLDEI